MSQEKQHYTKRVTIRFKPEEFESVESKRKATTCQKTSEYIRKLALSQPVVVTYRNQSADQLLHEMVQLKNELSAIGNNFNQSVHKLHTLDTLAEIKTWALLNENAKQTLFAKVEQIRQRMTQLYELWSHK
ncbi:MAG: plasmid mobilization relaxosome protein MobC [Sphingobacteriia bacterium]|nr:plasmid mobilization relaxosome protein MobC [Sphingobacteriia bacterium]